MSDTRRERLAMPLGRATMYLEIEDRFRRDDGTLREALDRFTFGRLPSRAWTTPGGLRAIAILPRPGADDDVENPEAPGTSVLRAWVAMPDGFVATLFVYVSPEVQRGDTGCAAIATSIVDALAAGPRALDTRGGPFSPLPGWRLDVPDGWARGTTGYLDWQYLTFERTDPLIGPTTRMHFSLGTHVGQEDTDWATSPGEIHGVPVTWREVDNGGWHVRETMLATPQGDRVVIRYESMDPGGYREAERIVGTLRPEAPPADAGCDGCSGRDP